LLRDLFGRPEDLVLNLTELSNQHDIRPLVLRTLLTYLELDGYLHERTPVYSSYQFRPLLTSKEILAELKGEPRQFMAGVFRQAVKKRVWFSIDLEQTAAALGRDRERVVRALDYCAERGWLEVRASDLRHRYHVARTPESLERLAGELDQRAQARERGEVERLDQVLALATGPGCLAARLSAHFGETLAEPCGRCRACRDEPSGHAPATPSRVEWSLPSLPDELADPRQAARFLCGISSPYLTRGKWTKDPRFGSLEKVPFREVMERLTRDL
jgi:ATP-dependent DNA helicase RecQ